MNKKVFGVLAILIAAVMLAIPISGAYATKPIPVSGGILVYLTYQSTEIQAGNSHKFFRFSEGYQTWDGNIAGDCVHNTWRTPGEVGGGGTYTFEDVTVNVGSVSVSGSLTINWLPHSWGWFVTGGTGELNNLRGHGTFGYIGQGSGVAFYTYSGELHFDPQ